MMAYGHSDRSSRVGVHFQFEHPAFDADARQIREACNATGNLPDDLRKPRSRTAGGLGVRC
jgi:hypothetical protein